MAISDKQRGADNYWMTEEADYWLSAVVQERNAYNISHNDWSVCLTSTPPLSHTHPSHVPRPSIAATGWGRSLHQIFRKHGTPLIQFPAFPTGQCRRPLGPPSLTPLLFRIRRRLTGLRTPIRQFFNKNVTIEIFCSIFIKKTH